MIIFDLICDCGFQFEGWFKDHAEFHSQQDNGLITCPQCNNKEGIRKILSPVAYRKTSSFSKQSQPSQQEEIHETNFVRAANEVLNTITEYVEKNFEDVGAEFTRKTLKIHYGVEEAKNIRGVVTADEEKLLNDEGIKLLKIPIIKKTNTETQ